MTRSEEFGGEAVRRGAATPARKQRVVELLCDAFARDALGTEELERRLDRAHRARTDRELAELITDLPPPDQAVVEPTGASDDRNASGSGPPSRASGSAVARIDPARVPDRQFSVAIWSGRSRAGSWVPARRITAIAVMGGVELDFREAILGPGETRVHVVALMGGVEIIVPPNLPVETSGFAIMGGFEERTQLDAVPQPDAPTLKVTGFAAMGGVAIDVRLTGESGSQATRRRKRERREAR